MSSEAKRPNITIKGNVRAVNLNQGDQRFYGPVTFSMGALSATPDDTRQQLHALMQQLADALSQLPAAQKEDVEVVQALAQEAVNEAAKDAPNKKLLEIKGENLKKAAENLAAVAPIAVQIARTLLMIG